MFGIKYTNAYEVYMRIPYYGAFFKPYEAALKRILVPFYVYSGAPATRY